MVRIPDFCRVIDNNKHFLMNKRQKTSGRWWSVTRKQMAGLYLGTYYHYMHIQDETKFKTYPEQLYRNMGEIRKRFLLPLDKAPSHFSNLQKMSLLRKDHDTRYRSHPGFRIISPIEKAAVSATWCVELLELSLVLVHNLKKKSQKCIWNKYCMYKKYIETIVMFFYRMRITKDAIVIL